MKTVLSIAGSLALLTAAQAQVLLSGGLTYSENFDNYLASSSGTATTLPWADNVTVPGWYASRAFTAASSAGGTYGPYPYTSYRVGDGSANNGWIWSFGTIGSSDRALGSLSSGTPKVNAFGVRIKNDTADVLGNVTVSYTGEQWRNGGNTTAQFLRFTYKTSSSPITDPEPFNQYVPGSEPGAGWTVVSSLDFMSPTVGATAAALDGNAGANRALFSGVLIPGATLNPGDEIFLRWYDIDDPSNDHGLGVDDFQVSFSAIPEPSSFVLGGLGLLFLAFRRHRKA